VERLDLRRGEGERIDEALRALAIARDEAQRTARASPAFARASARSATTKCQASGAAASVNRAPFGKAADGMPSRRRRDELVHGRRASLAKASRGARAAARTTGCRDPAGTVLSPVNQASRKGCGAIEKGELRTDEFRSEGQEPAHRELHHKVHLAHPPQGAEQKSGRRRRRGPALESEPVMEILVAEWGGGISGRPPRGL